MAYGMRDLAMRHARINESGANEGQKILESQRVDRTARLLRGGAEGTAGHCPHRYAIRCHAPGQRPSRQGNRKIHQWNYDQLSTLGVVDDINNVRLEKSLPPVRRRELVHVDMAEHGAVCQVRSKQSVLAFARRRSLLSILT